jgi:Skp family chaperone for outer membrane proteins
MVGYLKERLFPLLIAFSALSVSISAAFYSVSGLSKLFAGAAFAVIVMAASLEIAKLVIASLLYQYRKNLPKLLKWYLSLACVVLILITSMGIYGFLSAAYQETAAKAGSIDSKITLIEVKRDNIKEQLAVYNEEKSSINSAVADLRTGLSNNKIQYTDTLGNVITTTSRATRNALTKQLDQAIERQTVINEKIDGLNLKLFEYEEEIVEVKLSDAVSSELGPLKYLSGLTGLPMDRIINYLLLTIIFVFDPLAIALVVAANFAFDQIRPRTKENLYGETVKIKEKETPFVKITEEDLEADLKYGHEDEERMDVIGQNGNDGLHYEEEERLEIKPKEKETYAEGGYMQSETSNPPPISFTQEAAEINKIMGKDLTLEQMERLKNSKLTRTFNNDDDDLKIHY